MSSRPTRCHCFHLSRRLGLPVLRRNLAPILVVLVVLGQSVYRNSSKSSYFQHQPCLCLTIPTVLCIFSYCTQLSSFYKNITWLGYSLHTKSLLASISFQTSSAMIADPLNSRPDPGPDFVLLLPIPRRMVVVDRFPGRHHWTHHRWDHLRLAPGRYTS
jgi:hypothetical protein